MSCSALLCAPANKCPVCMVGDSLTQSYEKFLSFPANWPFDITKSSSLVNCYATPQFWLITCQTHSQWLSFSIAGIFCTQHSVLTAFFPCSLSLVQQIAIRSWYRVLNCSRIQTCFKKPQPPDFHTTFLRLYAALGRPSVTSNCQSESLSALFDLVILRCKTISAIGSSLLILFLPFIFGNSVNFLFHISSYSLSSGVVGVSIVREVAGLF